MTEIPKEQRKLATIMFTDMVGYSALAQKNEALALELLEEHRRLLRPIFATHRGREIKTIGDAFMVEFDSPVEGTRCAIATQQLLRSRNETASGDRQIKIRVGLHLGDVITRDGDVYGDGVNIAARIEPLARPEGICLTQQMYDHLHNKLDARLVKLGPAELKNIQSPVCVYRVELPWEKAAPLVEHLSLGRRRRSAAAALVVAIVVIGLIGLSVWRLRAHPRIESVAVVPLTNRSNDPEQGYVADGITDLITTELGKIRSLRVSSFEAVTQCRKAQMPIEKMAETLKVDAWVEGSVLRDGDRVAVTVRLIQAATAKQLWQTNTSRSISNIVDLQIELALALVEAMKAKLTPNEPLLLSARRPVHPDAVDYYLRAKFIFGERTDEAIEWLEKSVKADPGFARAHAQLAMAYISKAYFLDGATTAKAREALDKASALDPNLPEIYAAKARLAWTRWNVWDVEGSIRELDIALRLNPSLEEAYYFRGVIKWHVGLVEKAVPDLKKVLELNPGHSQVRAEIGGCHLFQTNYQKAVYWMTNFPTNYDVPIIENGLVSVYQHLGQTNEAWAVVDRFSESGRRDPGGLVASAEAILRAISGDKAGAERKIAQAQEMGRNFGHFHHTAYNIASAFALMNETEKSISWLRQTVRDGYANYPWFRDDPNLNSIRKAPEYIQLMAELEERWKRYNATI